MDSSALLTPFLGALQASITVLLTLVFGVLAAQFNLLSVDAAKEVSRTCVRMFLPALLIYKVGSELHQGTALRYIPILIWAIIYNLISMSLGVLVSRAFKVPSWVTPALAFNNTTSLPLLLIQSLDATGILQAIMLDGDTSTAAIDRAKSYFLVNAIVSNSMTFALGPRLLRPSDEDTPEEDESNGEGEQDQMGNEGEDLEQGEEGSVGQDQSHDIINEQTSLLPRAVVQKANKAGAVGCKKANRLYDRLPYWTHGPLDIAYQFLNAPLIGAVVGAIIGLTPALHKLFFNQSNEGGYLKAWLTSSIQNIGDLFASLQIIVVGVKLSQSLRKMEKGEDSGSVPWTCMVFVTIVRFIIWPLISIPLIWILATRTGVLDTDPMLWFAMMLMPIGPPAMILVALADVNGSPELEKMAIAKFLTISYAITPLICFAVVGSLKASEASIKA